MRPFALAVLVGALASAAGARDDDPIREKLEKDKEKYQATIEKVKELVEKPFTDAEDKARAKGDQKKLDELEEAQKAFEGWHDIPDGQPFAEARAKLTQARKAIVEAHTAAVKEYTKAKQRTEADAVLKELNQLREGWDALQVGSDWTGRIQWVWPNRKSTADVAATIADRQGLEMTIKLGWTDNNVQHTALFDVKNEGGRITGKNRVKDATITGKVVGERLKLSVDRRIPGEPAIHGTVDVKLQKR